MSALRPEYLLCDLADFFDRLLATWATKYDYLQTKLAAHDLYFHLTDWAELEFFVAHYSRFAVAGGLALGFDSAFLFFIWRLAATRVGRRWA